MDKDIEKRVKTCESCQKHQAMPASAPVHPWECTSNPWVKLHIYRLFSTIHGQDVSSNCRFLFEMG